MHSSQGRRLRLGTDSPHDAQAIGIECEAPQGAVRTSTRLEYAGLSAATPLSFGWADNAAGVCTHNHRLA
jgi:hypothetical protein